MEIDYIEPNIFSFNKFEDLNRSVSQIYLNVNEIRFSDIFSKKRLFIFGDPGVGKSRLLQEIPFKAESYGSDAIYIDLKKLPQPPIKLDEYIKEKAISKVTDSNFNLATCLKKGYYQSKNFYLVNNENNIICLDAIDEIRTDLLNDYFTILDDFIQSYDKCRIFISCRTHIYNKEHHLIPFDNFKFFIIFPLNEEQIRDLVSKYGIATNDYEKISKPLKNILSIPRYLLLFIELIKDKGIRVLSDLTRNELFDHIIEKRLNKEHDVVKKINVSLIKRFLSQLALVMEIYQTNRISEEVITIFDDLASDIKSNVLNSLDINDFYQRTILKDEENHIEFENREFQEFLAAKEIIRLGRVDQIIYDCAFSKVLKEIFPSWFNTLSFLINDEITLLEWILNFFKNEKYIDISIFELIVNLDKKNIDSLPPDKKNNIFTYIFEHLQKNEVYMSNYHRDLTDYLIYFYVKDLYDIKKPELYNSDIRKFNIIKLVNSLLQGNLLSEDDKIYWKERLDEFCNEDNENIISSAISALSSYNNISLLKKHDTLLNKNSQLITDRFLASLINIDPENEYSVTCFINTLAYTSHSIYSMYGLLAVKNIHGIMLITEALYSNEKFTYKLIHNESIFHDRIYILQQNIDEAANKESGIINNLQKFILKIINNDKIYYYNNSQIVTSICQIITKYNESFFDEVLDIIKDHPSKIEHKFLRGFLSINNFFKMVDVLNNIHHSFFYYVLIGIKDSNNSLFNWGINLLKAKFRDFDPEKYNTSVQSEQHNKSIYEKFQYLLEPQKDYYNTDLFSYYRNNRNIIDVFISGEERNKLITLAKEVLNNARIDETEIKINHIENNSKNFHMNGSVLFDPFHTILLMIKDKIIDIDITPYRKNIISYIPFCMNQEEDDLITLLNGLSKDEVEYLITLFTKSKDDKLKLGIKPFSNIVMKFNITDQVTLLKEMFYSLQINHYEQEEILKTISEVNPDKSFLEKVFNDYINVNDDSQKVLAEVANQYLINIFKDKSSLEWRFNEIKNRKIKNIHHPPSDVAFYVKREENEPQSFLFAQPIYQSDNPDWIEYYFDLLLYSFEIYEEDKEFSDYVYYIWKIVINYFQNLIKLKSFDYLDELKKCVSKYKDQDSEVIHLFESRLRDLTKKYIEFIERKANINECIQTYNFLKEISIYLLVLIENCLKKLKK